MGLGGQAEWPAKGLEPDWAGIKTGGEHEVDKPKNILPGDTKVSKKWTSAGIESGDVPDFDKKPGWIESLGQIFTYCTKANARYGYFITDEELVVFRIRPRIEARTDKPDNTPAQQAEKDGVLEFKSIPWENHSPDPDADNDNLTVNLALWWLHIMAAESSSIEEQYPPLKDAVWHTEPHSTGTVLVGRRLPRSRNESPTIEASPGKRKRRSERVEATISTKKSPHKRRMRQLPVLSK